MPDHFETTTPAAVRIRQVAIASARRSDCTLVLLLFAALVAGTALVRLWKLLTYDFSVFISYAHSDKPLEGERTNTQLVEALHEELKRRRLRVWEDKKLYASQEFTPVIARQIRNARFFVVIGDRAATQSQFVGIELGLRFHRRKWPVFGLDLKDIIVLKKKGQPHLQEILKCFQYYEVDPHTKVGKIADEIASVVYWNCKYCKS